MLPDTTESLRFKMAADKLSCWFPTFGHVWRHFCLFL